MNPTPKEMGMSHGDVAEQIRGPTVVAILLRAMIFLVLLWFSATVVYCSVTGTEPQGFMAWKWFSVAAVGVAIAEAHIGDYGKKMYGTEPGSIAYGFFLLASILTIALSMSGEELYATAGALIAIAIGAHIMWRRFELFDFPR